MERYSDKAIGIINDLHTERLTDDSLPECLDCSDFVDKAQDDLEAFYRRTGQ